MKFSLIQQIHINLLSRDYFSSFRRL